MIKNIFDADVSNAIIQRIEQLNPESKRLWGKMSVDQMLAHCCVTYEMIFENKHSKPNFLMRWILRTMIKNKITGERPYERNIPTSPSFLIREQKDFSEEKQRLIDYIRQVQKLGPDYFQGKESLSFGKLNSREWNNLFYKHLDHHLSQFGV